jgi:hypothetical protein
MSQLSTNPAADEYSRRLAAALEQVRNGAKLPTAAGSEAAAATEGPAATKPAESSSAQTQPVGSGAHVVQDGQCISSIARQTGHFWKTIWDDPANAGCKGAGRQPNVLMPGDRLTIPPLRKKQEPCQSEMRHRFRRRGEPAHLAIRVLDQDVPRANEPFRLIIDDGKQTLEGTTDSEGKLDVPIPGSAQRGKLIVGAEPHVLEYDLDLGGLDPVESWKGVQARLKNLGFECDITGECDEQTLGALNEFRRSVNLPPAKDADPATRKKLREKHGS